MKTRLLSTTALALSLILPAVANAQQSAAAQKDPANSPRASSGQMAGQKADSSANQTQSGRRETIQVVSASDLIGTDVQDSGGQILGTIEYLMIDARTGSVRYAIIAPAQGSQGSQQQNAAHKQGNQGGQQQGAAQNEGGQAKLLPVPWQALETKGSGDKLTFSGDTQKLQKSRYITEQQLAELTRPTLITTITNYWAPIGTSDQGGSGAGAQEGSNNQQGSAQQQQESPTQGGQGGQQQSAQQGQMPQQQSAQGQQGGAPAQEGQSGSQKSPSAQQQAAGERGTPHIFVGRQAVTTLVAPQLRAVQQIRGSDVVGQNGKVYGEIDDLIVDRQRGRVAYVQVSHGGYLGMGSEITPVPFEALNYDVEKNAYQVSMTSDELQKLQSFARGDQPTSIKRQDLAKLYNDFGLKSY